MGQHWAVSLIGVASCLLGSLAAAQEPAATAPALPTCAVVPAGGADFDAIPALPLLEVALAQSGKLRLVDREHIRAVLKENLLQAAVGAEGLAARRRLGELLRADLLVIVGEARPSDTTVDDGGAATQPGDDRTGADPDAPPPSTQGAGSVGAAKGGAPGLSLTIAETRGGLRLLRGQFAWNPGQPEKCSAELVAAVVAAEQKRAAGIKAVFAVPPFECEDLSFEYEHLMGAYAAVMEQALAQQPGVVVVELAEAQALARELFISAGDSRIRRTMPFYVFGSYRNDGTGAQRTLRLRVELQLQGRTVSVAQREALEPRAAGSVLCAIANDLCQQGAASGAASGQASLEEARLLRTRAHAFKALGHWREALALYEASLMLDANQPDEHLEALQVVTAMIFGLGKPRQLSDVTDEQTRDAYRLHAIGLDHLEGFWRTWDGSNEAQRACWGVSDFRRSLYWYRQRAVHGSALVSKTLATERELQEREMLIGVLEERAGKGAASPAMVPALIHLRFPSVDETPRDRYVQFLRLAWVMVELRVEPRWLYPLAGEAAHDASARAGPEYDVFLDALELLASDDMRPVVDDIRAQRERDRQYRERQTSQPARRRTPPTQPTAVTLTRVLGAPESPRRSPFTVEAIRDWVACASGVDLILLPTEARLLRPSGEQHVILQLSEPNARFATAAYDGAIAWVTTSTAKTPLYVIDPVSEQVWQFAEESGLPAANERVVVGAISPGRACVVGRLSHDGVERNWIALCEFRPTAGLTANVVYQQRRQPQAGAWDPDPETAQKTRFVVALTEPADPTHKWVLIGQAGQLLVVDASSGDVSTARNPVGEYSAVVVRGEYFYWLESERQPPHDRLLLQRAGLPDFVPTTITVINDSVFLPRGPFESADGAIHVISMYWWTAPEPESAFQGRWLGPYDRQVKPLWRVRPSAHYGLVLLAGDEAFTVQLDGPTTQNAGRASPPRNSASRAAPGRVR